MNFTYFGSKITLVLFDNEVHSFFILFQRRIFLFSRNMLGQSIVVRCGVIVDRCGVVERSSWIRRGVVVGGRGVVVRSLWSRCGVVVF